MSVVGVGIDLVQIGTFASQIADPATRYVEETFSGRERDDARRSASAELDSLAARFAVKEAFIKAWAGSRFGSAPLLSKVDYREIETRLDSFGRPSVVLHGAVAASFDAGVRVHCSLTHDGGAAAAVVILEQPG